MKDQVGKSKKNKFMILIFTILLFLIGIVTYYLFFFQLLPVKSELIGTYQLIDRNNKIEIYYYHSDAISNDFIQLRQLNSKSESITISNIDKYRYLKEIKLIDSITLKIILGNDLFKYNWLKDTVIFINYPVK